MVPLSNSVEARGVEIVRKSARLQRFMRDQGAPNHLRRFRSDHPELRKTSTCYVQIMSRREFSTITFSVLRRSRHFRQLLPQRPAVTFRSTAPLLPELRALLLPL